MGETPQDGQINASAPVNASGESGGAGYTIGPDVAAMAALAGAMLLWSGTFIAMKVSLRYFHPVLMVALRMGLSSIIILPFLRGWLTRTAYKKGDWRIIAALVLAEPCLYFIFEAYALQNTTASQAGVITALLPLLVGVAAFFILKERLPAKAWVGFLLAMVGVAALSLCGASSEQAPDPFFGNMLELAAMCAATVYTLCVRRLPAYSPFFITAFQSVGGAVFFACLTFAVGAPLPDALPPAYGMAALVFLSCSSVVAYGLYNIGIRRIGAARAAAWVNAIPGLTLVMGIVLLGESLTLAQMAALVPLFLGLALSQMK